MISRRLAQVAVRQFSMTARRAKDEVHPGYEKLKKLQEHFQKDNGVPVHIKGGGVDGVLYRGTLVMMCVGFIGCLTGYYQLMNK